MSSKLSCKALRSSCLCDGCRKKTTVRGPLGANISASQPYSVFQRLRHSDLMLKFIYYSIHTLFNVCSCLLQRHRKFIWTSVKPKRGGVVRILSLPSTVHNFRPQISVYRPQLPSTYGPSRYSFIAPSRYSFIARARARMNELKMGCLQVSGKDGNQFWLNFCSSQ